MEAPKKTVLPNGLTVVTQYKPDVQPYLNISTNVGSRYETPKENGLTHFLEHMQASDTEEHTSEELSDLIDSMGGMFNASTSKEKTDYYLQVEPDHLEEAMRLLANYMTKSIIEPERLENERGAIQEERAGAESDPSDVVYDMFCATAFPGTGLDKTILGTKETIASFQKEDFENFKNKHYTADNMVLTVVGDVDHDEICKMAEEKFAELPEKHTSETERNAHPAIYRGGYNVREHDSSEQINIIIGFESAGSNDRKADIECSLLGSMLAGGFASPLYRKLRSNHGGLVYGVGAGNLSYSDNGSFVIQLGTSAATTTVDGEEKPKVAVAFDVICDEINRFIDENITEEKLDRIRTKMKGSKRRSTEATSTIGRTIANAATVNGRVSTPDESLAIMDSVTVDDLKARAKEIFSTAPTIAAYGKGVEHIPSYEEFTAKIGKKRELDETGLAVDTAPSPERAAKDATVTAKPAQQQLRQVG